MENWIERAKVITERGYQMYQDVFSTRLTRHGNLIGIFDAPTDAIRHAERLIEHTDAQASASVEDVKKAIEDDDLPF